MASTTPTYQLFARGWPAALEDLRSSVREIEPDLTAGLYAMLVSAGVNVGYWDADVISGRACQFLYALEHPECAQLGFSPPTDTLFRAFGVTWKEVSPSDAAAAYDILREWISQGRLCLARLREPLLVFGYSRHAREDRIVAARLSARLAESSITLEDCERSGWRYPIDEGNVLVTIESVSPQPPDLRALALQAARRTARAWFARELAGCSAGDAAYRKFAADLSDPGVDFTGDASREWMGPALWQQWTSRRSLHHFFERAAPRFGGTERQHFSKAAFHFGQCVEAWQHWADYLGPSWSLANGGFARDYPDEFIARWRDSALRIRASRWVEEARGWEAKAVLELTKLIQ